MKILLLLSLLLCARVLSAAGLPRATPESQGVSSSAILEFVQAADKSIDSLHSFMLLRHGQVLAETWWAPYNPESPHVLFSLSKSFTSTAVGLAIAEGKLSVDDPILKFFPDDAPAQPSSHLKAMRIRDLLRMNTGHETEPPRPLDKSWIKAFLEHPVKFKPGTHFLYNTSATYILAAIVEKTTGLSLLDYLQPRLLQPIGIQNATWDKSPEGITLGGYGMSIRTEDIARFGQLYLQQGKWHTKQILPAAWVQEATSFQTSNGSNPLGDWDQGYGYQFWRSRHGAYRGDGAFGQYCLVLPAQDAVIAITAGLGNMQSVLDLIWEKLLPAFKENPLPENKAATSQLAATRKNLSISAQKSETPANSGQVAKTFHFPENPKKLESITLQPSADSTILTARFDGADRKIEFAHGQWRKGETAWGTPKSLPIAASGGWSDSQTFTGKICFYETPFIQTIRLTISGDELRFNSQSNVGFGPTKDPELIGTAK